MYALLALISSLSLIYVFLFLSLSFFYSIGSFRVSLALLLGCFLWVLSSLPPGPSYPLYLLPLASYHSLFLSFYLIFLLPFPYPYLLYLSTYLCPLSPLFPHLYSLSFPFLSLPSPPPPSLPNHPIIKLIKGKEGPGRVIYNKNKR